MNVYFFPTIPYPKDGYSIVVCSDLDRLQPDPNDFVVWYNMDLFQDTVKNGIVINGPSKYSIYRWLNVLSGKLSCEFIGKYASNLKLPPNPDKIFCGDIHFYRYLRSIYPDKLIDVRFHNCYSRISNRIDLLQHSKPNLKFRVNLLGNRRLEKIIFNDNRVNKIFISKEDQSFYTSMMGKHDDSTVWGVIPNLDKMKLNRNRICKPTKLVWFGGIQAHKSDSVNWFIDNIFQKLKEKYPNIEFHLFGSGTSLYNNPTCSIYGHGRYEGSGMPFKENGIFINPDLTGGGVKIKLKQYFENGVTFITNPFGFEGYSYDLVDNEYCYCEQLDKWYEKLDKIFSESF